jgi:hypothetical protein
VRRQPTARWMNYAVSSRGWNSGWRGPGRGLSRLKITRETVTGILADGSPIGVVMVPAWRPERVRTGPRSCMVALSRGTTAGAAGSPSSTGSTHREKGPDCQLTNKVRQFTQLPSRFAKGSALCVSGVIRPRSSDLIFDHPYDAESQLLAAWPDRRRVSADGPVLSAGQCGSDARMGWPFNPWGSPRLGCRAGHGLPGGHGR